MSVEEAIQHAIDGEAILFLGSGFSYGGINVKGTSMKIGRDLSHEICKDLSIEMTDDLTISSSRYIDDAECKKGLKAFIEFLKKELECVEITEAQASICALPWKRIYTTNYDNIIELATREKGFKRETITITNERYAPARNLEQAIVHINGYIERLSEKSFFEEFKITDDSYNKDGLLQSDWKNLFVSDLEKEKAIIFIGYSLNYDQELVRTIASLNIQDKCVFIDIESLDQNAAYKISKYGELYKFGTDGLADKIREIENDYTPSRKHIELVGFEKADLGWYYSEKKYNVVDVVDFLVKGRFNREYMNQSGYCVLREESVNEVCIKIATTKVVILQSRLGNGKTIFLECLANKLLREYNVFFLKNLENYINDLQIIQSSSDKMNVILVDDYGYYIKLIADLGRCFPDNMRVVLTCRTSININLYYDLLDKYHYLQEDVYVYDLDELKDSEVKELVSVLSINRLWGSVDTLKYHQKKRLIEKKYSKNLANVFYILLESEVIKTQIEELFAVLAERKQLFEFVLMQAINLLCGLKFSYTDLVGFVGISETLLHNYALDAKVREILDVTNHKLIISSSIFSQYLMRQKGLGEDKKQYLEKLYTECSKNDGVVGRFKQQRRFLISRSNIKLAFSENKKLEKSEEMLMFSYYDSIKNLPTATDNPFFWLQFAITSLNLENYDLAKIQFENSYANAENMKDFDTYQIDTHYARMLLCSEMKKNKNEIQKALEVFITAHKLLIENRNTGANLSYVLRQTSLYYDFFETYKKYMSYDEQQDYLETSFEMCEKYKTYFAVKEIFKIPYDIARCYIMYRKLFLHTPYQVMLKECDRFYNNKVPELSFRVRQLF